MIFVRMDVLCIEAFYNRSQGVHQSLCSSFEAARTRMTPAPQIQMTRSSSTCRVERRRCQHHSPQNPTLNQLILPGARQESRLPQVWSFEKINTCSLYTRSTQTKRCLSKALWRSLAHQSLSTPHESRQAWKIVGLFHVRRYPSHP